MKLIVLVLLKDCVERQLTVFWVRGGGTSVYLENLKQLILKDHGDACVADGVRVWLGDRIFFSSVLLFFQYN